MFHRTSRGKARPRSSMRGRPSPQPSKPFLEIFIILPRVLGGIHHCPSSEDSIALPGVLASAGGALHREDCMAALLSRRPSKCHLMPASGPEAGLCGGPKRELGWACGAACRVYGLGPPSLSFSERVWVGNSVDNFDVHSEELRCLVP